MLARKARQERVADLRCVSKLTWRQIGAELSISHEQARRDFHEYLKVTPSPLVEQVRAEEEPHLLDLLQENRAARRMVLRQMAREGISQDGILGCVVSLANLERAATRASESRRRLHGADMPERKEYSGPGGGAIPVAAAQVTMSELAALMDENERDAK